MTKVIFVLRDGCGIHEAQLATYKEATGLVNLWAEGGIRTPHLKLINSDTGVTTFAIEDRKDRVYVHPSRRGIGMSRITALEAKLSTNGSLSLAEQWEAVRLAKYYRKLLAMQIAERAYLEMKNYGQIDEEIRPLGYMLVRMMNSRIPVLEELKPFSSPVPTGPPEKVGGALDIGKGW